MEPTKPAMTQKEYLKRYLLGDKKHKRKKKKAPVSSSSHLKRSVIIDDDINVKEIPQTFDETFNLDNLGDEAPQIAGFVDDRPEEMKLKEKLSSGQWRELQAAEAAEDGTTGSGREGNEGSDLSPPRRNESRDRPKSRDGSADLSPPRRNASNKKREGTDGSQRSSLRRKESSKRPKGRGSSSDLSPPRRKEPSKRPRGREGSSDLSPPRRNDNNKKRSARDGSSDLSPPRKHSNASKKPKGRHGSSDMSPPRRKNPNKRINEGNSSSDLSPPRRKESSKRSKVRGNSSDLSPPRRKESGKRSMGPSDRSPVRRNKSVRGPRDRGSSSDLSPPRLAKRVQQQDRREPRRRAGDQDEDLSPPRKGSRPEKQRPRAENNQWRSSDRSPQRRPRDGERNNYSKKSDGMQDGKRAGLQDAKSLKDELRSLKEKEEEVFRKMDPEVLGRSTAAVIRDRRTGLKRDFEKERIVQMEKAAKNAVRQQKYEKWGKGLKQARDQEERAADLVREMSKPLARYADDTDLERVLKAQEREGDPMLDYIRTHQRDAHVVDLTTGGGERKKYIGAHNPNRFGVRPGHRWDGVDRSNGYEQKWFEARNSRKAVEEEAWKWSSADM